ncbi:Ribonuclease P protein component [hydrothermal vent metagenome]|uniref:Ribonuclease P protein component n=1 Tax=hydrothermal vent metagenome TaxID=652676 RepID=A0A3B0Y4C1_9ZZZZ
MPDESACFDKHVRLLKPDEYSRVFKNPIRSSDRLFIILAVKNENSHARLGLAISKKNTKRAVDRNMIKRLVRESFRLSLKKLPFIDIVVMAKPVTKSANNQQIFQSLQQHWSRLSKQCAKSSSD